VVQQPLGQFPPVEITPGYMAYRRVQGLVVVGGGHDEIAHGDQIVLVCGRFWKDDPPGDE
jgi:hypothetical protein